MADARNNQSLTDLFSELTREITTLMGRQIELARVELSQKVQRLGRDLAGVVLGAVLATGGLLAVLAGIVLAVAAAGVPAWASALIVGVVVSLVGYFIARRSMAAISREDIKPQAFIDTLKESAEWVKTPTKT